MTIPAVVEYVRCKGELPSGDRCNKLLGVGVIIVGSIELKCPKCGRRFADDSRAVRVCADCWEERKLDIA